MKSIRACRNTEIGTRDASPCEREGSLVSLFGRQVLDSAAPLARVGVKRQQLQVYDATSDGQTDLRHIDHTHKRTAGLLTEACLNKKIFVLRYQYASQFRSSIEKLRIGQSCRAIFLSSDHVNVS